MKATIEDKILKKLKGDYIWDLPFEDIVKEVYRTRHEYEYLRDHHKREYIDFNENKIYGHTVKEVIEYLKTLDENAKFGDNYLNDDFSIYLYNEVTESDDDYVLRLRKHFAQTEVFMKYDSERKERIKKRKEELLKELEEINSKL